jgi:hypothetical protein
MAMPVDRRQLELIASREVPVVARAKPVTPARVVEVPALDVRVWGKDEEKLARGHMKTLVTAMGLDAFLSATGLEPESVAKIQKGAPLGPDTGERVLGVEVPEGAVPLTREERRSRRKREVRARTISTKRLPKRELELGRMLYPEMPGVDYERPKTRGDCERLRGRDENGKLNACCFVSCRWNLYLDVNDRGSIKLNFPDIEPEDMVVSCALDVASDGPRTLEEVGALGNRTRERIRQEELIIMAKIEAASSMYGLRDFADEGPQGRRRLPVLRVVRDEPEVDESEGETEEGWA